MTTKQEPSHPQLASLGGSLIVAIGDVLGSLWEMRGEEPSAAFAALLPSSCEITKDRRRSSSLRTHVVFMLSAAFFSLGLFSPRGTLRKPASIDYKGQSQGLGFTAIYLSSEWFLALGHKGLEITKGRQGDRGKNSWSSGVKLPYVKTCFAVERGLFASRHVASSVKAWPSLVVQAGLLSRG